MLIEDGSPVLSVSLVAFAGNCEAAVHHIADDQPIP